MVDMGDDGKIPDSIVLHVDPDVFLNNGGMIAGYYNGDAR
jgi:hypothetical protein